MLTYIAIVGCNSGFVSAVCLDRCVMFVGVQHSLTRQPVSLQVIIYKSMSRRVKLFVYLLLSVL